MVFEYLLKRGDSPDSFWLGCRIRVLGSRNGLFEMTGKNLTSRTSSLIIGNYLR